MHPLSALEPSFVFLLGKRDFLAQRVPREWGNCQESLSTKGLEGQMSFFLNFNIFRGVQVQFCYMDMLYSGGLWAFSVPMSW